MHLAALQRLSGDAYLQLNATCQPSQPTGCDLTCCTCPHHAHLLADLRIICPSPHSHNCFMINTSNTHPYVSCTTSHFACTSTCQYTSTLPLLHTHNFLLSTCNGLSALSSGLPLNLPLNSCVDAQGVRDPKPLPLLSNILTLPGSHLAQHIIVQCVVCSLRWGRLRDGCLASSLRPALRLLLLWRRELHGNTHRNSAGSKWALHETKACASNGHLLLPPGIGDRSIRLAGVCMRTLEPTGIEGRTGGSCHPAAAACKPEILRPLLSSLPAAVPGLLPPLPSGLPSVRGTARACKCMQFISRAHASPCKLLPSAVFSTFTRMHYCASHRASEATAESRLCPWVPPGNGESPCYLPRCNNTCHFRVNSSW